MAQAARLASRLHRELKMLQVDPPPGVCAWPCDDLLTHLQAQIMGPHDTVYSNGIFKLDIQVPERYPFEPPNIRFVTPVYHPNIDSGGRICLDILNLPPKGAWRPSLNLATLLASIGLLLAEPNPDDGLMGDITAEYKHNRTSFDVNARKWTELYATQDQVAQKLAPYSQLPDQGAEVEKSPIALSNETLASTGGRDCERIAGNGAARYVTSSQSSKPGPCLSKRLTLERGTESLLNCKADSDICRGTNAEIQRTIPMGKDDSPTIVLAEKRNSPPPMTAEERAKLLCTQKENQAPKNALTSYLPATDTSTAAEKVKSSSFAPNSVRGKLKLMKEAGEQVRPAKSLKLSKTKGEQHSSPALSAPGCKHLTDIEKRCNSPILIPDDVATVIVSDSDSGDESGEGHFRISLTQRSLNLKRNGVSKLR